MNTISIAIYLDVENITGNISIEDLMDDIRLKVTNEFGNVDKTVFALKKAIGDSKTLKRFRNQLNDLNFIIQDTPHVVKKKNRADLIISVDALEKLHVDNPSFDLFVFLTSDSDYSIVMNTLRKYNKQVWLVATDEDSQRNIFKSSTDKILIVNDYKNIIVSNGTTVGKNNVSKIIATEKGDINLGKLKKYIISLSDKRAVIAILKVLKSYEEEKIYTTLISNNNFRQIEENLQLSQTNFKNFKSMYKALVECEIVRFLDNSTHEFKILDKGNIIKKLNSIS